MEENHKKNKKSTLIAIVGAGSIGQRHLKNLLQLGYCNFILVENNAKIANEIKSELKIPVYKNTQSLFKGSKPKIVFVCVPTHLHIKIAKEALEHNCHVFIEKPLSVNLRGVDGLVSLARKKKKFVMIGSNYTFHPGFQLLAELIRSEKIGKPLSGRVMIGQDLSRSRADVNYKQTYAARRALGGGVILDSGSHAVAYLQNMFGKAKSIMGLYGNISSLGIEAEDYADAIIEYAEGVVVHVALDYFSKPKRHSCEVQCENGWARWDFPQNIVEWYDAKSQQYYKKAPYINMSAEDQRNDMYIKEIEFFLETAQSYSFSLDYLLSAKATMHVLLALKKSGKIHKRVNI